MFEGKCLKFEMEGSIGIMTINMPPHNIFKGEFFDELYELEKEIQYSNDIRCIVVEANGKSFSAGLDLDYLEAANSNHILTHQPWLQNLYTFFQEVKYPVICAIQGQCVGSGVELIVSCDIRIAAEDAKFNLPEVGLGLAADMCGTARLTRLVGVGQAKRLALTCEKIDAEEARRIGLVEIVVPLEELHERAMKVAKSIVRNPEHAVRFAKMGINAADENLKAGLLFEQAQAIFSCGTDEFHGNVAKMKEALAKKK